MVPGASPCGFAKAEGEGANSPRGPARFTACGSRATGRCPRTQSPVAVIKVAAPGEEARWPEGRARGQEGG